METPQYFVWVIHIPWYRLLSYFSDSLTKKFIFIGHVWYSQNYFVVPPCKYCGKVISVTYYISLLIYHCI